MSEIKWLPILYEDAKVKGWQLVAVTCEHNSVLHRVSGRVKKGVDNSSIIGELKSHLLEHIKGLEDEGS